MLKRFALLLSIVALVGVFAAPAGAQLGNGCTTVLTGATDGDPSDALGEQTGGTGAVVAECTYVASSTDGGYTADTPNAWDIVEVETGKVLASGPGINDPAGSALSAGSWTGVTIDNTIRVRIYDGCAGDACGWIGQVAAGDAS